MYLNHHENMITRFGFRKVVINLLHVVVEQVVSKHIMLGNCKCVQLSSCGLIFNMAFNFY